MVITVKKDKSVKIALDSKELNDAIHKNKYQMQSVDRLIDAVATYISERSNQNGIFYFSKTDLKYAYSQLLLDPELQKHCNFNKLGGKATGTYRFLNGFYGLPDMLAIFQKTIDATLQNCHNKFAFLDDILVITKGNISDHEKEINKILYQLDKENLAIKLQRCDFAKKEIIWQGFQITRTGITPTKTKCDSINKLEIPKTLKQLRSFMGCIHHLIKFTPKLAELSEPLRPLLSKNNTKSQNKLDWNDQHTTAFEQIKKHIINITENKHFDINKETRVKCDASRKGLGAALEQRHNSIWKPVAYASRFLNKLEEWYRTNELELLAIVWALEYFKFYLYGIKFILQTDHQALLSALKNTRGNKTYQSRLSRWVDRLLPFNFTIEQIPGKNMGFEDYLSRNPSGKLSPESEDDEKFVINTIHEIKHAWLKHILNPSGIVKPTSNHNHSAERKQLEHSDVTHAKENTLNEQHAFCLNIAKNKSHLTERNFNSINHTQLIAITTRNNPNRYTFDIKNKKRKRDPNKKILQMDTHHSPDNQLSPTKQLRDNSTQTDADSNKGKGITAIQNEKHEDLFTAIDDLPTPDYRKKLMRVFNEEFLAEHSKKDLGPIIDMVNKQDWLSLKQTNPIFHKIWRDLSVKPTGCWLFDNKQ